MFDLGTNASNQRTLQFVGTFPGASADYEDNPNLAYSAYCYLATSTISTAQPLAQSVTYVSSTELQLSLPNPVPDAERECDFKAMWDPPSGELDSSVLGPQPIAAYAFPDFLGMYYWAGGYQDPSAPSNALPDGVRVLDQAGFQTVRIAISPNDLEVAGANSYGISPPGCPANQFLPCAVSLAPYQAVLANPSIKTLIFTAYDSTTLGQNGTPDNVFNLSYLQANAGTIVAEYQAFVAAVASVPEAHTKQIIVDDWETDNALACDDAYDFARNTVLDAGAPNTITFQDWCAQQRGAASAQQLIDQEVSAIAYWFQLRKQGIQQGAAAAASAGTPLNILDAAEISSYNQLFQAGFEDTLRNVIPSAQPSCVTYSSYESLNNGSYEQDLNAIQTMLVTSDPGALFGIGEIGVTLGSGSDYGTPWMWVQSMEALNREAVPFAVIWEGFVEPGVDMGLFNDDGSDRIIDADGQTNLNLAQYVRDFFDPRLGYQSFAQLLPSLDPSLRVAGYYATTTCSGCAKAIELYGSFDLAVGTPNSAVRPTVLCDANAVDASTIYIGPNQINVVLETLPSPWCTVSLDTDGGAGAVFGPMYLPAND